MGNPAGLPDLTANREAKSVNTLELGAKVAAGMVAITYVSGYLIETTYLSTFGIHADASDLLRAKYLYIGFDYWFFVSVFAVLLILVKRFFDFIRKRHLRNRLESEAIWANLQDRDLDKTLELSSEEQKTAKDVIERRIPPDRCVFLQHSFGNLRWALVVSSIIGVFSLQIVIMSQTAVRALIPLEFVFLLAIALHQTTHFREYFSHWGIIYGREHVALMRAIAMLCELWISLWIACRIIFPAGHDPKLLMWVNTRSVHVTYWVIVVLALVAAVVISGSVLFGYKQLEVFQIAVGENLTRWERYQRWLIGGRGDVERLPFARRFAAWVWRALTGTACGVALWLYAHPINCAEWLKGHRWAARSFEVLGGLTLLLALYIPANIIILSVMRRTLHERLKVKREAPSLADRCVALALRLIPSTVLYLISVLSFAHLIYPSIPDEKAGGSYMDARVAILYPIKSPAVGACTVAENDVKSGEGAGDPHKAPEWWEEKYIILAEDSHWLYIAPLHPDNGPAQWRKTLLEVPKLFRPEVRAVDRGCISDIAFSQETFEEMRRANQH